MIIFKAVTKLFGMFKTSFYARMVAAVVATFMLWQADRAYQRYVGGNDKAKEIVEASNEEAGKRDDRIKNQRRNRPKPSAIVKRLRDKYAATD